MDEEAPGSRAVCPRGPRLRPRPRLGAPVGGLAPPPWSLVPSKAGTGALQAPPNRPPPAAPSTPQTLCLASQLIEFRVKWNIFELF